MLFIGSFDCHSSIFVSSCTSIAIKLKTMFTRFSCSSVFGCQMDPANQRNSHWICSAEAFLLFFLAVFLWANWIGGEVHLFFLPWLALGVAYHKFICACQIDFSVPYKDLLIKSWLYLMVQSSSSLNHPHLLSLSSSLCDSPQIH